MTDRVQFQTNIPVEVALKYESGKDVSGQYGDQVLYTLTGGRVMYVPPIVRKQIEDLGVARDEVFTITKAKKKNDTRRTIEWQVTANGTTADGTRERAPSGNGSRIATVNIGGRTGAQRIKRTAGPDTPLTSRAQVLKQALAFAVDAAAETERYASTHGIALQFTSEDIREIGLRTYAGVSM